MDKDSRDISKAWENKKNPRLGKCYELAGDYVLHHPDTILVHGRLTNPFNRSRGHLAELDHAWVEIKGGTKIFDPVQDMTWPKDAYEGLFKAKVLHKYTQQELLTQVDIHETWGPWK